MKDLNTRVLPGCQVPAILYIYYLERINKLNSILIQSNQETKVLERNDEKNDLRIYLLSFVGNLFKNIIIS